MENGTIDIIEVGPRDGLQSQPTILSTEAKLEFVQRFQSGVRSIAFIVGNGHRFIDEFAGVLIL